ncbi:reverse transcriptase domain-containing protein [Tanacetum coccineum]|uniref:Reverse transcriptase domain-containing protein n=1 Tax=Tanacetum coccineum TaxID=301880 RepID=A0ABQ5FUJ0_9ASTR
MGTKYTVAAVDYLSKWVEAKALPTNDARVVCKFLKSLFAQFGTPRAIITYGELFDLQREQKRLHDPNGTRTSFSNVVIEVLLFNFDLDFLGQALKPAGTRTIQTVASSLPLWNVELLQTTNHFKVNGYRLKHTLERTSHRWKSRISKLSHRLMNSENGDCPGFLKSLVLAVWSLDHKSFTSSTSFGNPIFKSYRLTCQKPGHLAARLGCSETKVATWDDLAFKLIVLGWNETDIKEKDTKRSQKNKTEHGTGKSVKAKVKESSKWTGPDKLNGSLQSYKGMIAMDVLIKMGLCRNNVFEYYVLNAECKHKH